MQMDFIIRDGRVLDPAAGVDEIRLVGIRDGRIVPAEGDCPADRVIDAAGCIVTPGLIDAHAHLFSPGSGICVRPELLAAQGTTTAMDAGSAGCGSYEAFHNDVIRPAKLRLKSFVNLCSKGMADGPIPEDYDPARFDADGLTACIDRHREEILGLKLRLSRGIVPEQRAAEILDAALCLTAELERRLELPLRLCVHTTDAPIPAGQVAARLRPGDIFCHCYQGAGNGIVQSDGSIVPEVLAARGRGVLFDAANGKGNFSLETARAALKAGFLPDLISSDLTAGQFLRPPHVKSLPAVLSKYLELGLSLEEILARCTAAPARLLGLDGRIGTLQPGAQADIAVFRLATLPHVQRDFRGDGILCRQLLLPLLTMKAGEPLYCAPDFWL